jgi:hypothetical protein
MGAILMGDCFSMQEYTEFSDRFSRKLDQICLAYADLAGFFKEMIEML